MRWLPQSVEGRLAVGVVAVVVGLNVIALVVDALVPSPEGPRSSSFATAPHGVAAWADLERESGAEVRALRSRPSDDTLPSDGTVVVLDPEDFSAGQARALRRFAERGGRVVAGGADPGDWLAALTGERAAPEWDGRRFRHRARARAGARDRRRDARDGGGGRTLGQGEGSAAARRGRRRSDRAPADRGRGPHRADRRRVAAPQPAPRRGRQRRARRSRSAVPARSPSWRACTATAPAPGSPRCPAGSAGHWSSSPSAHSC